MAAQLTGTQGPFDREPRRWIARAATSLPTPVRAAQLFRDKRSTDDFGDDRTVGASIATPLTKVPLHRCSRALEQDPRPVEPRARAVDRPPSGAPYARDLMLQQSAPHARASGPARRFALDFARRGMAAHMQLRAACLALTPSASF